MIINILQFVATIRYKYMYFCSVNILFANSGMISNNKGWKSSFSPYLCLDMVAQRKNIPSYIAQNLRHLRNSKRFTLERMADLLDLQDKTSYYAYESGKAIPDVFKLLKIASLFDVSLEELVNKDLSLAPKTSASVTLYQIEKIPFTARAGYATGYGDPEWIATLPIINVPYKPYGIARAFEIEGDSMEPEYEDGSIVLAIKVDRTELKDKRTYIVVTKNGLLCKDIRVNENDKFVYLISKNTTHPPRHIEKSEVIELWEVWKKIKPGEM